jgi:preprotein translocase subunit SecD
MQAQQQQQQQQQQGGSQVAIVLDNEVVSAPQIQSVIVGDAIINGSGINDVTSKTLATQLRYGSLPLNFKEESFQQVTATLGLQQMKYGLLAGAIGLGLVVLYCLFYYRGLGLVVIASLAVSGGIIFAALVLLGRVMGFTLSLAGIAGFIVAIGITADSFVVYFERLKDEVKDGRTVRSAVPRAWKRARRTILSADAVSFLAAAVLYIFAAGPVKGFAFTLGLSTIIDLVVVFLFTYPLVALLSRSSAFSSPRFSGLGNARSDKAIEAAGAKPSRFGVPRTKES